jgi:hypothetical protein
MFFEFGNDFCGIKLAVFPYNFLLSGYAQVLIVGGHSIVCN